jgi:SAM-dependent methyltransferase
MEGLTTNSSQDMRKYERRPYFQPIHYSVNVTDSNTRKCLTLEGKSLDISEAGIRIQTDQPLSPGRILWFDGSIEDKAGFVRWCLQHDKEYRVGIELDKTYLKTLDQATDVFNRQLEDIEEKCLDERVNSYEIRKAIADAFNDICETCAAFENGITNKDTIREAQIRFRTKTDPILSKSYCLNRARTWPQGYQGDHKTLEGIYRNTPLSKGIGYYLDEHVLDFPLGIAVRNRIKRLEDILRDELQHRESPSVLNIACGSCREVFELASDIERSGARFTCIDLDDDALSFAANRLSFTAISPVTSDQVIFRKYNAVRMFDHEMNMNEFGLQDIIYSVGLYDYLPTDFLINLFRSLYRLIKPGGRLIVSFKDASRYRYQEYHWLVEWDGFLQRTEEDFKEILSKAGIPDSALSEMREESGIIIFYLASK